MPVISPLARDADGAVLNINADIAAGTVAGRLQAAKFIYLSDVPGIMRDPMDKESLIPSVTREKIEQLREDEIIAGGMIPKVESALHALGAGRQKGPFHRRTHPALAAPRDLHQQRHRHGSPPLAIGGNTHRAPSHVLSIAQQSAVSSVSLA